MFFDTWNSEVTRPELHVLSSLYHRFLVPPRTHQIFTNEKPTVEPQLCLQLCLQLLFLQQLQLQWLQLSSGSWPWPFHCEAVSAGSWPFHSSWERNGSGYQGQRMTSMPTVYRHQLLMTTICWWCTTIFSSWQFTMVWSCVSWSCCYVTTTWLKLHLFIRRFKLAQKGYYPISSLPSTNCIPITSYNWGCKRSPRQLHG